MPKLMDPMIPVLSILAYWASMFGLLGGPGDWISFQGIGIVVSAFVMVGD